MPDEADFAAVVTRVQLLAQTAIDPILTLTEVQDAVRKSQRGSTWVASTAYLYGAVVVPTVRNGHYYRAVKAGTSHATTQPTWPESFESEVGDGTVTWEEAGQDFASVYNIRKAVEECWMLKAAKAQNRINFSVDGSRFDSFQTPEFCMRMAQSYGALEIA